jgi:phytoene dehydrogenase-like protein
VSRELELHEYGLQTVPGDPACGYMHPDGPSVCLFRDARKTVADIEKVHSGDAKAYAEYAEFLDALMDVAVPMMLANMARPRPSTWLPSPVRRCGTSSGGRSSPTSR